MVEDRCSMVVVKEAANKRPSREGEGLMLETRRDGNSRAMRVNRACGTALLSVMALVLLFVALERYLPSEHSVVLEDSTPSWSSISRWESYVSHRTPSKVQAAPGTKQRAREAQREFEKTRGQAIAIRKMQMLHLGALKEKEREQRQKNTEALEASMMRQDRGRQPLRNRVHKKLLASTVSEDKLDKLMLGRVDEDEKAIATLSNAVYKLRSMDSQIKHYDRLRSY